MSEATDPPWRPIAEGLVVRVRVTPRASRNSIGGIEGTGGTRSLCVRVTAVPEDGAANAAVGALLAEELGVGKRAVNLVAGGKSRIKSFAVTGDPAALVRKLSAFLETPHKDGKVRR